MKFPMNSRGRVLLTSFLDHRRPLGSQGRILGRGSRVGYLTSTRPCGNVLLALKRQEWELISGPSLAAKTRLSFFNRMQSRVITGLWTGHNTLRRHLYIMRPTQTPLCQKCRAKDETSAHVLCRCEALATLTHHHLGSFFLDPEESKPGSNLKLY
jgi:hypothetical protein